MRELVRTAAKSAALKRARLGAAAPGLALLVALTVVAAGAGALLIGHSARGQEPSGEGAEPPAIADQTAESPEEATRLARELDERVEITSEREESANVYMNPDGTRSARLYSAPVRVREGGSWRSIDPRLEATPDALEPVAGVGDLSLSDGGAGTVARLAKGGKSISLETERSLPKPEVAGRTARYRDAFGGADLELEALSDGFSERIVLDERPSDAPVYRFDLRTDGLRADVASDERLRLRDSDGKVFALSTPARMWGSEKDPETDAPKRSAPLDIEVGDSAEGQVLEIRPDESFLADPEVKLPITIDPTVRLGTNQDTFAYSASPNDNTGQGSGDHLRVGWHGSAFGKTRTFIHFPTDSISPAKHVLSAWMHLYQHDAYSCTASAFQAHRPTEYWHNSGISWNTQPTVTSYVQGSLATSKGGGSSCPGGYVSMSINAGLVQAWVTGTLPNYGLMLRAYEDTETHPNTLKTFASANHPIARPPYLDVNYNTRPNVPDYRSPGSTSQSTPAEVRDLTPTLSARYTDPDAGDSGYIEYQVLERLSDGSDRLVAGGRAPASGGASPGTQLNWTVPEGKLAEHRTYWWRAQAEDGIDFSPWSDARWIRINENANPPAVPDGRLPADGAVLSTPNPTLEGFFRDPDPGQGNLDFRVKTEGGTQVASGSGDEVSSNSRSRWQVPNDPATTTPILRDDTVYAWDAQAVDTDAEHRSAWSSPSNRFIVDRTAPVLDPPAHQGLPASWAKDSSPSVTATARDAGTGVKRFRLTTPNKSGVADVQTQDLACQGNAIERCPQTASKAFSYSTTQMPEGINTVKLEAIDGAGRVSAARAWTVKIDRSGPTITNLSGSLRTSRFLKAQTYDLRVDATDSGSGVRKIDLLVDGASAQSKTFDCPAGSCPASHVFSVDASTLSEGRHELRVLVEDALGHQRLSDPWFVTADRSAPQVELSGRLAPDPDPVKALLPKFLREESYDLKVVARDGEPPPADPRFERSGAVRIDVLVDGVDPTPQASKPCPNGSCSLTRDFILDAAGTALREGRHTLSVVAEDGLGHKSQPRSWAVIVDRSKPDPVELSGTLKTAADSGVPLVTGSYTLTADSDDGDPLAHATGRPEAERSGMTSTRIFVDDIEQQPDLSRQPCPDGSCPQTRTWNFQADNFSPGTHRVRVEAADQVARLATDGKVRGDAQDPTHITVREFEVKVDSVLAELSDKSGLEDFFHYETTETGAGTEAHTNLATGNLVWHSTPIKNPGRGLSTVANLTYNSQKRVDLLAPLPYRQTGTGFSLGVSGLTRLNEPLQVLSTGVVSFTDPDGTRHDFTPTTDGISYKPPPGVNLHLRRYSPDVPKLAAEPTTAEAIRQFNEHWAITQPNGVTHFFDVRGYPTYIRDRNGNEIEFKYEAVTPLDQAPEPLGLPCSLVKDAVCRVTEVIDPGGRSLKVRYGDIPTTTSGILDFASLSVENKRRFVASFGRITELEDHAGRILGFEYGAPLDPNNPTQALPDRLTKVTEAKGRPDQREWNFTYRTEADADPNELPATDAINVNGGELAEITDPKGQKTGVKYELSPIVGPVNGGAVSLQRVDEVTNRRGNVTKVDYKQPQTELEGYDPGAGVVADRCRPRTSDPNLDTEAKVTDARGNPTTYKLDRCARMFDMAARLKADDNLVTKLEWDEDHNVTAMEEGIKRTDGGLLSAPEEDVSQKARTEMAYNLNGMLTSQRDPNGHVTNLRYRDGSGVYLTPLPDGYNEPTDVLCPIVAVAEGEQGVDPACSADGPKGFVSDLIAQEKPRGAETPAAGDYTWKFDPDRRGNVLSRTTPEGGIAHTEYYAPGQAGPAGNDAVYGIIKAEIDEETDRTEYRDYEAGGNPQVKVDPKYSRLPQADQKVWRYDYDPVGNVRVQTDPRGHGQETRYTTRLDYDSFDRLTSERKPKDSQATALTYIEENRAYDRNGNLIAVVDGNREPWTRTYTAMDKPATQSSPPSEHFGSGATKEAETTSLDYDQEDNVIRETKPEGQGRAGDHVTESLYDALGRKTVEIRRATGADQSELVTSRAYDRRGNMVSLVDPKGNEMCSDQGAHANAADPGRARCRRYAFEYDRADNQTAQVENPAGDGGPDVRALRSETRYDANDNEVAKVDPRTGTSRKEYDQNDRPVAEIDELGRRKQTDYYADNQVKAETSPKGTATADVAGDYTTEYTYDPNGDPKTRSLPHDRDQYGSKDLKVAYERDPVGNPTTITDARRNSFANAFFDSGELKTTGRPSWFKFGESQGGSQQGGGQGEGQGGQQQGGGEQGGASGGQSGQGGSVSEKSPEELLKDKDSGEPDLPSSEGKGDLGEVRPAEMPDLMPKAGETTLGYDDEMRLTSVKDTTGAISTLTRDATGRITEMRRPLDVAANRWIVEKSAFDRNGNLRQSTDGEGHATTTAYDGFDRPVRRTEPGTDAGPETSRVTYNANDQVTREETPRGVATTAEGDYTKRMEYDRVDRTLAEINPAGEKTTYTYDAAGNKVTETSPRGNTAGEDAGMFTTRYAYDVANQKTKMVDGFGEETRYSYDRNGNETEEDAPGASSGPGETTARRITRRAFEGRDLPWKETTGQGAHKRTTVTEHDPNGNLRREVKPAGVDEASELPFFRYTSDAEAGSAEAQKHATVRDYSKSDLLEAIHQPWGEKSASDRTRYAQRFEHSERGFVTGILAPHTASEGDSDEKRSRLRTSYKHFDTGWIREQKDPDYQRAENKSQTIDYDYDARGNQTRWNTEGKRSIRRSYYPSGQVSRREAAGRTGTDGTRSERHYTYGYNENGTLREARDLEKNRTTSIKLDAAERELLVNEAWAGGKDSALRYDPDGNVRLRQTDGKWTGTDAYELQDAKTATFVIDRLGREKKTTVNPEHGGNRITNTTYHPSGEREQRRRNELSDGDPAVVESTYHYSDGRLARMRRVRRGGAELKDRTYTYDRNGNRKQDERGDYEFNARDQVTKWSRGGQSKLSGSVSYDLNGSGSMTSQQDSGSGTSTSYAYDGDRLMSSSTSGGSGGQSTSNYAYDDFGSTTQISGGAGGGQTGMEYDEFGRMKRGTGPDGKSVTYTYDALDRRDSKTESGQAQDMSYVGTSESLSEESGAGKDRSYDYTSDMERLGQAQGDGADSTYKGYAKDANGSVEGLEEDDGEVKEENKYSYDPYGETEKQTGPDGQAQDPEASLGEAAKDNPFRFEGFYQDSAIKSYDMQARPYRPDVGRFLTQDRFEESKGDFELQSDPLTQNRYAFAGGNPVNNVEWDGHSFIGDLAGGFGQGIGDAAKDAYDAGRGLQKASPRSNPGGWQAQAAKNVEGAKAIAKNPGAAGKAAGESLIEPYKKGSVARGVGRGLAEVATSPAKALKAVRAASAAAKGAKGVEASNLPQGAGGGPGAGKDFPKGTKYPRGTKCAHCGSTEKIQRDHIVPKARGGNNSDQNRQPLCARCNQKKGTKGNDHAYSERQAELRARQRRAKDQQIAARRRQQARSPRAPGR